MVGINKTIFDWAEKSGKHGLLKNISWFDNAAKAALEKSLGERDDIRYAHSVELCEKIWSTYPELGVCPMLSLLAEAEYNRSFYPKYRDHVTHSLKVFLLGLFAYEENRKIKDIFEDSNIDENAFIRTWMVVSLWHDMGYLVENNAFVTFSTYGEEIISKINEKLKCSISHIVKGIEPETETGFYSASGVSPLKIDSIAEVESDKNFKKLKYCGDASCLTSSRSVNSIQVLYEHMEHVETLEGIPKHKNHGIFSALLLLILWDKFDELFASTSDFLNQKSGSPEAKLLGGAENKISSLCEKIENEKSQSIIMQAAQAIALHSINKNVIDHKALTDKKIDIASFAIKTSITGRYKPLPFAYLLKLIDELQDWDRHKYNVPDLENLVPGGEDMDIEINRKHIGLWLRVDDITFKNPEHKLSKFKVIENKLSQYIELDRLLRGLKASQIEPRLSDITKTDIIDIFYNVSHRELMDCVRDAFRCTQIELLLYNRTDDRLQLLHSDGKISNIGDELHAIAYEKFREQNSFDGIEIHGERLALALISTHVGAIGFILLHKDQNASVATQEKFLNNYGMLYGALVLKALQIAVKSATDEPDSTKALGALSKNVKDYIPFGDNDCISIFLDIRKLSALLDDSSVNGNRQLLQLIHEFSIDVEIISKKRHGMISSHFGGGMLITFQAVSPQDRDSSCCRAVCAMIEIRKKFDSLVGKIFKGSADLIKNKIKIGMGACAGTAFFSAFGYSSCIYYTGVGDDISFAKKIEYISGRFSSEITGSEEMALEDKILVSQAVYKGCKKGKITIGAETKEWVKFLPVTNATVNHYSGKNNVGAIFHVSDLNKDICPLLHDNANAAPCYCCTTQR